VTAAAPLGSAPGSPRRGTRLLSDGRLARRAAEGDQSAFEAIYSRYHKDLYRFCLAMVGNPQDAQDALQNTMVKVLRALPGEKRKIHLRPWLYRIARNESIETLRRRHGNEELEPERAAGSGVAEEAETRERLRTLLADLERLPERQRAALVMRELAGLDFAEIGAAFGGSAAVARQTLYEARLSLRRLEAGREMRCADVMRELSDADGRVTRRREIRAHLRVCANCRAFREDIAKRHEDLAALAPLPLAASAGLPHGALGGGASGPGASAGLAGGAGVEAGKAVATSVIVKSAATVAVATVVGVSAADRGGVIDLPLPGKHGHSSAQSPAEPQGSTREGDAIGAADVASQSAGVAQKQPLDDGAEPREQGEKGSRDQGDERHQARNDAAPSGPSESLTLSPPGGGNGRAAPERHGRSEGLPEASDHGQQNAATHKPSHAASPPGQSGSGGNHGESSSGGRSPAANPAASPAAQAPAADAGPGPPVEAPSQAHGGPPNPARGGSPPGLER
jgi:RNA polymerase sigma factor (sigma-70 family)